MLQSRRGGDGAAEVEARQQRRDRGEGGGTAMPAGAAQGDGRNSAPGERGEATAGLGEGSGLQGWLGAAPPRAGNSACINTCVCVLTTSLNYY